MSDIYQTVIEGRPLATPFIDIHGHFGPWSETTIPYALDRARVIAEMDRYGCDQVWMSASGPGFTDDLAVKNDYVFDFAREFPDRIIPYCTLSANCPRRAERELKRCLSLGRCIGVKMHRYCQEPYTLRSDFMQGVLEILQDRRMVYINHDLGDRGDVEWAVEKYPQVAFVAGHFSPDTNDLALEHPNLFDCACAAHSPDELEREVARLGRSDTMLVGSDFSLFHLGFGIGMVAYARMSENDKENILYLNALKLLRRMAWFGELKFPCKASV